LRSACSFNRCRRCSWASAGVAGVSCARPGAHPERPFTTSTINSANLKRRRELPPEFLFTFLFSNRRNQLHEVCQDNQPHACSYGRRAERGGILRQSLLSTTAVSRKNLCGAETRKAQRYRSHDRCRNCAPRDVGRGSRNRSHVDADGCAPQRGRHQPGLSSGSIRFRWTCTRSPAFSPDASCTSMRPQRPSS
jgi:hypothetical protein